MHKTFYNTLLTIAVFFYGDSFTVSNIHGLLYLSEDVTQYGFSLNKISCFSFENYCVCSLSVYDLSFLKTHCLSDPPNCSIVWFLRGGRNLNRKGLQKGMVRF